jgi:flagellar protein FliS
MTNAYMRQASAMYQQTSIAGQVESADSHKLIAMLLDGAIDRIGQARAHLRHGNVPAKGAMVTKAVAIVSELRASLNHEAGGTLAGRLDALYDYINRRLLFAQLNSDDRALAECIGLLEPVRQGWNGIRDAYLAGRAGGQA